MKERLRSRGKAASPRKSRGIEPKRTYYIICEGKKTEPNYFRHLKKTIWSAGGNRLVNIVVDGCDAAEGNSPKCLVEAAIEKRRRWLDDFESEDAFEIWCVFDVEAPGKIPELGNTMRHAEKKGINTAICNPAFEFWFLLHFGPCAKPFHNADSVIKELKKAKHWPQYRKNIDVFSAIAEKHDAAMKHAVTLRKTVRTKNPPDPVPRPHTNVDCLIRAIDSMLRK